MTDGVFLNPIYKQIAHQLKNTIFYKYLKLMIF